MRGRAGSGEVLRTGGGGAYRHGAAPGLRSGTGGSSVGHQRPAGTACSRAGLQLLHQRFAHTAEELFTVSCDNAAWSRSCHGAPAGGYGTDLAVLRLLQEPEAGLSSPRSEEFR